MEAGSKDQESKRRLAQSPREGLCRWLSYLRFSKMPLPESGERKANSICRDTSLMEKTQSI